VLGYRSDGGWPAVSYGQLGFMAAWVVATIALFIGLGLEGALDRAKQLGPLW
jgi:hypothetical protein